MATDTIRDYATHEDISRLEGQMSRLEGHVETTQKDVRRLEGHVQATQNDVRRVEGYVQATREDFAGLEVHVRKTQKDVGRLEGSILHLVQRMDERLDRIDNRLWMFMGTILVFTLGIVLTEAV